MNDSARPTTPDSRVVSPSQGAVPAAKADRLDRTRRTPLWILIRQACRVLMTVLFDVKVYGAYYVPRTGGVLIVSNHQSYLDPIVLSFCLDRTLSYLAKAELFKNRYFGWLIRNLNAFAVEQGAGDIGAVKESIARLQEGHVLNIFPEGSRTENGEILPFEKGVALVIRRAKVPVVPVAIVGSWEAWPKEQKFPSFRPIRVLLGPPMEGLWKLDRDEIIARLEQTLGQMYKEFRAGHIPPLPPRPRGR
ncbi:MAG TPA: lysophospholipid acyltransferase family protein [Tepidisphaeraceae bacterium]|jgi:1-acyl-sn-glycerol-3-phosphate acyltransferase|nr:lysophospholipid acyltransferase family protein [Tepidisphaeraceae bacterium]